VRGVPPQHPLAGGFRLSEVWVSHRLHAGHAARHRVSERAPSQLTAGTGLHRSKLPLTLWFHAAYLVATLTPGISALQFQKQLGISRYETAFQLLHKLRSVLAAPTANRCRAR